MKGSAAVAWEEWRDCADHATECKAGKVTGDGWSDPSRVLLVIDPKGVVHGVGASGSIMLTSDEPGMSAVMMSSGQRESVTATPTRKTPGQSTTASGAFTYTPTGQYVATGRTFMCPS